MPTPNPPSAIWGAILAAGAAFAVDPPIVQDANFRANSTYFSYVDSQIRGLETHVVQSLVSGLNATWVTVDASSAAVSQGDVVCLSGLNSGTVLRATATPLAAAGMAFGIALQAAPPGGMVPVAVKGKLTPAITGLPTSGNQLYARAISGRVATVASLGTADFVLGTVDAAGNLTISIQLPAASTGTTLAPGTAGQVLFTNSTPAIAWTTLTGDVSSSVSTIGQLTVVGLRGNPVPAPTGTGTTLVWNAGGSGTFSWGSAGGGGVTWANDLAGNGTTSSSNQYVSSLSFSSSTAGGSISVNGTNTLLNWITNAVTFQKAGTTVVQLGIASTDFVAFGGTPGASGFVRATANATIVGVNGNAVLSTDATPNTNLNAPTGSAVNLQINAVTEVAIVAASVTLTPATLQWGSAVTSPTFTQASISSATQGQDLTVIPQQSTQATNFGGGNVVVALQTPGGTGVRSWLRVKEGSSTYAYLGRNFGGSGFGALYLGPSSPAAGNHALLADGATQTTVNVASGGTVFVAINSVAQVAVTTSTITLEPATVQWDVGISSPTLTQSSTSSATQGQNLNITPQQSTQATNFGGGNVNVNLQVPGGSGTRSYLQVLEGGTAYAQLGRSTVGSVYSAVYLGQGIAPSNTNHAILSDGSVQTQINGPTGGTLYMNIGGVGNYVALTTGAFNVYSGGAIFNPWQGTANSQTLQNLLIPFRLRTTTNSATTAYSFTLAAHTGVAIEWFQVGRCIVTGVANWTVVDKCLAARARATVYYTGSGSPTIQTSVTAIYQDTGSGVNVTTAAGGVVNIQVTATDSTSPTVDWQGWISLIID